MNPRKQLERIRTRLRIWRLTASVKYDDLRIWWYKKKLAYLRRKHRLYERRELVDESREFQEDDER